MFYISSINQEKPSIKFSGPSPKNKEPVLRFNQDKIPDQLKSLDHWVGWKSEKHDGNFTKVPYNPSTGERASSTDPNTWAVFDNLKDKSNYGLGFVFTDSPFAGIDLDHCRSPDTGELNKKAEKIVKKLDSYTEISPSGEGLHVLIKGEIPGDRNRKGNLEIYDSGRYFTVTGKHLEWTPEKIKERSAELEELYKAVFKSEAGRGKPPTTKGNGTGLSDEKVLKLARNAKNGDKFKRLWKGNKQLWEGNTAIYDSHSEADIALCSMLAFYTGPIPDRIDRLFRRSGLARDKWKDRPDYREMTIREALTGINNYYQPSTKPERPPVEKEPPPEDTEESEQADLWNEVSKEFAEGERKEARYKAAEALLNEREFVALSEGDQLLTYKKDEGIFNDYGREYIEARIQDKLTSKITTHDINEIINHVERLSYRRQRDFGPDDPGLICVKNGTLNLETGELADHSPDYEFQRALPVKYDPEATSEKLDSFLKSTLREKDIPLIEEVAGFCLYREYFLRKAIMFIGEGGNGKTITLQLIENLLGHENVAGWTLQELESNQFAKAGLYKKFANIAGDLPGKRLKDTGIFKQLTGRDHITGDVKYSKRPVEFVNYAKLLFSTNNVPATPDDTEAFFDRWILVEFPYKFVKDPSKEKEKKKDPNILDKITTEKAKSAFLNRAIKGLRRLRKNGEFSFKKDTSQVRKQYERLSQPIKAFVDDYLIQDEDNFVPNDIVYNTYREYCEENELPIKAKNVFSRRLSKYIKVETGQHRIEGERKRCYEHINLDKASF